LITDKGLSFNQKSGFRSGIGRSIGPGLGVSRSVRGLSFDRSVVRPGVGRSIQPDRWIRGSPPPSLVPASSVACPLSIRRLSPQHPSLVRVRVRPIVRSCFGRSVIYRSIRSRSDSVVRSVVGRSVRCRSLHHDQESVFGSGFCLSKFFQRSFDQSDDRGRPFNQRSVV